MTLPFGATTWLNHDRPTTEPRWQNYPRVILLATTVPPYSGEVLCLGHDLVCPDPIGAGVPDPAPCRRIATGSSPQVASDGPDPNAARPVVDWNNNNAALQHRLKPNWVWDPLGWPNQYDLNRVIATGGTAEIRDPDPAVPPPPAYAYTLGWNGSGWSPLSDAPEARVYSNFTLLPDGNILLLGGQSLFEGGGGTTNVYRNTAASYNPVTDTWTTLAVTNPELVGDPSTPRGYHSVAILLPDGTVVLKGGQDDDSPLYDSSDSPDSIDHYRPPYCFKGSRPTLGQVPDVIKYGQPFTVKVVLGASPPGSIVRFCLMGLGSVTHHFDYGQRYVELMHRPAGGPKFEILPPPVPSMAPDGYYMLFGVDSVGRPSLGVFVRLAF
jgi:hypothetical protein